MAKLIEVKPGMRLPVIRLALVVSSSSLPPEAAPVLDRGSNRTFYAGTSAVDIALVSQRATVWADQRSIPNVYLQRDP
jgi:hypothetical protein